MEAKRLCSDRISNLPSSIIEIILRLVPTTQEAARTSVLSTEWKYHWTQIPKLVFIEDGFGVPCTYDELEERLSITSEAKRKLFSAINQVMSMHQCPIHEFSLSMYARGPCVEIDHIIDNLLRTNTVEKLTLDMRGYRIPESLFSLHKLTDLYLHHCRLDVQPTFGGFGNLANLFMEDVIITKKMLLLLLSSCPLLKTVILNPDFGSLPNNDDTTLIELFECLPVIENLSIRLSMMKYFDQGRVPKKLPAALVHLKRLCIMDMPTPYEYRIPCYVFLIRSSPNLEKLKMKVCYDIRTSETRLLRRGMFSDVWLEHLNELEIEFWTRMTDEFEFMKLILAKSPVLKKVKMMFHYKSRKDEELRFVENFLRYPRVSKVVEIIVESGVKFDRTPFKRGI